MKILLAVAWLMIPVQEAFAQNCVPDLTSDCDGDGFTAEDGDCDDLDPQLAPGIKEECDDELDNDCDGLYDDGCDVAVRQGGIRGGGGCTGNDGLSSNTAAGLLLLPLVLVGRKR